MWSVAILAILLRAAPLLIPGWLPVYRLNYDEGVYFSAAALLAQGVLPYRDFVMVHPPGLVLLLTPLAALSSFLDPAVVFTMARVLGVIIGVANVLLVGRIGHRYFGPLGAVGAALLYAVHPEAVKSERGPMLEPLLNLVCLGFALLWLRILEAGGARRSRFAFFAGLLAALAIAVKLWAGAWILAALVVGWGRFGGRQFTAAMLGGLAGVSVTVLPFLLISPAELFEQVIGFQAVRPPQGLQNRLLRLGDMAAAGAFALLAIPLLLLPWWRRNRALQLAIMSTAVIAIAFIASPVYFQRYTSFLAPAAALLGGAALAGWLAQFDHRRVLRGGIALGFAIFVLAHAAEGVRRSIAYRAADQPGVVSAVREQVPMGACLFSMEPGWGILGGRLPEHVRVRPVVDAHAARILAAVRAGIPMEGAWHERTAHVAPQRRILEMCEHLLVGSWGLGREERLMLTREWVRIGGGESIQLWRREAPAP